MISYRDASPGAVEVACGDAPSEEAVLLARGKYGFYVQQGELRASICKVCLLSCCTTQCSVQKLVACHASAMPLKL